MSETNVDPTNCLDIIEQLRYDRDKYIGMWRRQCNIAEEVMRERDLLTAERDFGQTYKKLTDLLCRIHRDGGQAICKYGVDQAYVNAVQIVLQTFDRADTAESELARYKSGVEMDGDCQKEDHNYVYPNTGWGVTIYGYKPEDCPYCEIDRLTAELAETRETRNALADFGQTYKKLTDLLCRIHRDGGQAIGKYRVDKAYVDAVKIVLQTFDRAEKAESELARYKSGVEVETIVHSNGSY